MSIRLYVGNLPKSDVEREELQTVFADAGELVSVKVIKDRKTGKCRGFGFVTVETDEQADQIIEKYNGAMFQEKALPKAKGQEDEDGDGEPTEPREPSSVPKPNLSNKNSGGSGATSAPQRNNSGGSGGAKKASRKDGNKSGGGSKTYTSTTTASDSFQPDPRWAGKLAELKDKLAQSGNP
jgi:RNA recognition motif-containing protein